MKNKGYLSLIGPHIKYYFNGKFVMPVCVSV
jgi:hypothetical protein